MTLEELVTYEIASSWWAGLVFTDCIQEFASRHFVKKALKKLTKYNDFMRIKRGYNGTRMP